MSRKKSPYCPALTRAGRRFDLTEREMAVAAAWSRARGVKGVADGLQISVHTVNFHLRNIYRKIGAHCHAEFFLRVYLLN